VVDQQQAVRRLTVLAQSASTARVLNLVALHNRGDVADELSQAPLFRNRLLDRSIIVKHRLRPEEYDLFRTPRATATKLLIPIDTADLRVGARAVFVGQHDFDQLTAPVFGDDLKPGSSDRRVLEVIDGLVTLDPFLLREHLKRHDIEPAQAYFGISVGDIARMHDFVRAQIMSLVALTTKDGKSSQIDASRLVDKLLSNAPDSGFEPLKDTLRLSDPEYQAGVFAWRGFLYYKWKLGDLLAPMAQVSVEVADVKTRGPRDAEAETYLPKARDRIQRAIARTFADVGVMLATYDSAYQSLTRDSQPMAFRDFLLRAPSMFASLGEQLGAIQHITSFWRFRFPQGRPALISPGELMDVLLDFEDSLSFTPEEPDHAWVA
jgi:hypothetical protein